MVKRVLQAIISSLIFLVSTPLMALEEPKYTVIESAAPFELRKYSPMIIAEVTVDGDMSDAGSKGFRLIAGYIFGKNQTKANRSDDAKSNEKIAMRFLKLIVALLLFQ